MNTAYSFSTTDEKTYTRKLHGFEALCNSYALHDFLLAYTGSVEVQLKEQNGSPVSETQFLKKILRRAWILLRHQVPSVALRTKYHPEDASWTVLYDVPSSLDDIDAWVHQTLFLRESEKGSLDHDIELGDMKWAFTNGEYSFRLIASMVDTSAGKFLLSVACPHGLVDGRMSMILLDQLVGSLNNQLSGTGPIDLCAISWGDEPVRLAPTGAVLTGLMCEEIDQDDVSLGVQEGFVPFLPPFVENKKRTSDVTTRLVVFNSVQTTAFRDRCRRYQTTVTVAMDAVFALAQVEAVLRSAAAIGGDHYASTIEVFNNASHWFMPLSCKDQRPSWPKSSSIDHPRGTPLFGTDGFALQIGMETLREAIGFSSTEKGSTDSLSFNPCNQEFFWNAVEKEMSAAHSSVKKDLNAYVRREREKQAMCRTFNPALMMARTPISSSIGHLEGLGLFTNHTPDSASLVLVHQILIRIRSLMPTMTNICWQYDGKLNCYLQAASRWNSPVEMDAMEEALRKWFEIVIE